MSNSTCIRKTTTLLVYPTHNAIRKQLNMTGMTLQFIDQGAIGIRPSESDRRIIRSHVMRGKNAGRPRPSRRKQTTIVHLKHPLTSPCVLTSAKCEPGRPLLWNDLCLTSFPQQLDSESTKLMHRCTCSVFAFNPSTTSFPFAYILLSGFFDISDALFPPQFCSKFDMIKSIWVNYVLADEACE